MARIWRYPDSAPCASSLELPGLVLEPPNGQPWHGVQPDPEEVAVPLRMVVPANTVSSERSAVSWHSHNAQQEAWRLAALRSQFEVAVRCFPVLGEMGWYGWATQYQYWGRPRVLVHTPDLVAPEAGAATPTMPDRCHPEEESAFRLVMCCAVARRHGRVRLWRWYGHLPVEVRYRIGCYLGLVP